MSRTFKVPRHKSQYRPDQDVVRDAAINETDGGTEATCVALPTRFASIALPGICFEQAIGMSRMGFSTHRRN